MRISDWSSDVCSSDLTDWRRDNYFSAVRQLAKGAKRIGIEFDHVSLDLRRQLEESLPGVEFVDIGQPSMWMRTLKSPEEQKLIREGARICDVGGAACVAAIKAGVPEHEVAIATTNAMIREIAKSFPYVELMDPWTWFQRSEEHTSELQSLMRISYAVFCLKKKNR